MQAAKEDVRLLKAEEEHVSDAWQHELEMTQAVVLSSEKAAAQIHLGKAW